MRVSKGRIQPVASASQGPPLDSKRVRARGDRACAPQRQQVRLADLCARRERAAPQSTHLQVGNVAQVHGAVQTTARRRPDAQVLVSHQHIHQQEGEQPRVYVLP